jgi:tight adherence protein B
MPPTLLLSSILLGFSVALLAVIFWQRLWRWLPARVSSDAQKYEAWANDLFIFRPGSEYRRAAYAILCGAVIAPFAVGLLTGRIVLALAVATAIWWAPLLLYRHRRYQRMERLDEQLPDAVEMLVASARAGRSLQQAMQDVAQKSPGPVGQELGVIANEHFHGGLGLAEALVRARARIKLESFTMVSSALIISLTQGGDLLNILERITEALRELLRLKKKLQTETTEVRAQEKIILLMTPLFGGMICLFDPEIPEILFDTIPGNLLLAVVAAIQIVAVMWVRRIIRSAV